MKICHNLESSVVHNSLRNIPHHPKLEVQEILIKSVCFHGLLMFAYKKSKYCSKERWDT